ncbi:hypothetical protein [Dyadobacter sp. NIV53]|uniref:hypothetical protein n=1 Tax=Dyadobacter sp. NIV53 TaxID=2861765 RepID=UPI001C87D7B4|nr:hypothetical protein [Dyadobacter sp. NIV53]
MGLSPFCFFNFKNNRTIIDLRPADSYTKGSFPKAVSVPFQEIISSVQFAEIINEMQLPGAIHLMDAKGDISEKLATQNGFDYLEGGFNAFKIWRQNVYVSGPPIGIIAGKTGSGKTELLRLLAAMGHQVIDLEKLASHKGSVFGNMDEDQPDYEQFQHELLSAWLSLNEHQPVWMEEKGHILGNLGIPEKLYQNMTNACYFELDVKFEDRLAHIKEEYTRMDKSMFAGYIRKLEKRMGFSANHKALYLHATGQTEKCLCLLLEYYDRAYEDKRKANVKKSMMKVDVCVFETIESVKKLEAQIMTLS